AQTSFGRRGRFCPTRRPLFHGVRKGLLFELISMGMVDLHARPLHRIALIQRAGRCNATAQTRGANTATANGGSQSESCRRCYGRNAPGAVFPPRRGGQLKSTRKRSFSRRSRLSLIV